MAQSTLSRHDFNVLEKIKDPEANPLAAVIVDQTLPRDPHVADIAVYERVAEREREIVVAMQQLEMQLAGLKPVTADEPIQEYRRCILELGQLISEYPKYASARNNRAQALRRLYGDIMMLPGQRDSRAVIQDADDNEKSEAAATALSDLDEAITLLTPKSLFASISPQAGKTLSLAHTQRAAIYYRTAKLIQSDTQVHVAGRKEVKWAGIDFEGAASRDFALGGRYGNEIAKGLAVSTNPTAKLCGQMVREAMKKEYGPAFAS
ncbi:hypothetical protein F5X99DRAFT_403957 [Biscogniauxia marginata]|nr:hypothetical protein F5X99DRAFT_403957 [Biscogniauxia marginata]